MKTVTRAVAGEVRSLARIAACSVPGPTKVVARAWPFHRTLEAAAKPEPPTVSVKAAPTAAAGLRLEIAGTGLSGTVTVNGWDAEVPPPGAGLKTVTRAVAGEVRSLAGIAARSVPASTTVAARAWPFQRTLEAAAKPEPLIVSVKAELPLTAVAGLRPEIDGTGLGGGGGGGAPLIT